MFLKHRSKIRKSSGKTDAMILELIDIYYRNCIDEWELRQMFCLPLAVPERSCVGLTIHKTLHGKFSWWLNMITKCKGCPGEHEIKHILPKPYIRQFCEEGRSAQGLTLVLAVYAWLRAPAIFLLVYLHKNYTRLYTLHATQKSIKMHHLFLRLHGIEPGGL